MSLVGRHIGRYRILEPLGQGGMSVVYKGLDTTLDRVVAVKVLHAHLAERPESRKRLEQEAKAVARLHHPNILEVFDFSSESSSEAYLVTEYIRGRTLREFINTESLQPPEIAAMVVYELASALAHAHEALVLHRDLKPENVMVRDDGVLKLMDFGIAKIVDRDEKMTMTGALVGSPAHMAPEIIEGEPAGAEADVFSLGTMLYLFATGKLPFTANNTTATLKKILDCTYLDPRQVVPLVSDELAEIIAHCLQRQPADRFPTAAKLRDALFDHLSSLGLLRPNEELSKFFLDPSTYRKELVPRVTEALLARAQKEVTQKRAARAMAVLNQVLVLEPTNARANALLGQLRSRSLREARAKRARRAGLLGGLVLLASFGVLFGLGGLFESPTEQTPPPVIASPPAAPLTVPALPAVDSAPAFVLSHDAPSAPQPMARQPVKTSTLKPPVGLVDIAAVVRPFGFVQVDDEPPSTEALARHALKVTPGRHRFTVTCEVCEARGQSVIVDVHQGDELPLVAPLQPSLVTFRGWPDEATVRVGVVEKSVKESQASPFRITTPPSGSLVARHKVDYVVSMNGGLLDHGSQFAFPGQPLVIERPRDNP
jgi:serine/threonine protein kinase